MGMLSKHVDREGRGARARHENARRSRNLKLSLRGSVETYAQHDPNQLKASGSFD